MAKDIKYVVAIVVLIVLALGFAGRSDYQIALESERDNLRVDVATLKVKLAVASMSGCNAHQPAYVASSYGGRP